MTTPKKIVIAVAPFIDRGDLVVDVDVDGEPLDPVRVPLFQLLEEYIAFNSEMFEARIATANRNDATALAGLFRLCAKRLEEVT